MEMNYAKEVLARKRVDQLLASGELSEDDCAHLDQIHDVTPSAAGCGKCLELGDPWVNLRICLTCGHVGCCDNSINKHATKHHHATGHPVIQSFQPDETWIYCYPDEDVIAP
jgi:uncharacterized UBP type Zn finger protein